MASRHAVHSHVFVCDCGDTLWHGGRSLDAESKARAYGWTGISLTVDVDTGKRYAARCRRCTAKETP